MGDFFADIYQIQTWFLFSNNPSKIVLVHKASWTANICVPKCMCDSKKLGNRSKKFVGDLSLHWPGRVFVEREALHLDQVGPVVAVGEGDLVGQVGHKGQRLQMAVEFGDTRQRDPGQFLQNNN